MTKNVFWKGLVIGIILLFVGASITGAVSVSEKNNLCIGSKLYNENIVSNAIDIDLNFTEYELWKPDPPKCGEIFDLWFRVTDELGNLADGHSIEIIIIESDIPDAIGLTWLSLYSSDFGFAPFLIFFEWGPEKIPYSFTIDASIFDPAGEYNEINPSNNQKTFTKTGEKSKDLGMPLFSFFENHPLIYQLQLLPFMQMLKAIVIYPV